MIGYFIFWKSLRKGQIQGIERGDTPAVKHLVIPALPTNEELSDSQLEMVAGGIAINPSIMGLIAVD